MTNNKLALVTGGGTGLGKAIAIELGKQKIDIILHYNNSLNEAQLTASEIENEGVKVYLVKANFFSNEEIESFFSNIIDPILEEANKGLDILVNNAGISKFSRLNAVNGLEFDNFFSINVKAPLILMKDSYARMNKNGRIINISSTTVERPFEKMIVYGASKAALENLSRAVLKDFGRKEITVNTVAPGFIPTDMLNINVKNDSIRSFILKNTAIKRLGTPEDIAKLIKFLTSVEASWINGQNIEISGGVLYN